MDYRGLHPNTKLINTLVMQLKDTINRILRKVRMLTWWNCCASTVAMNEKQQQGLSVNLSANAVEIYK
jgi:hypothetical protein